jgi:hypothetical protein
MFMFFSCFGSLRRHEGDYNRRAEKNLDQPDSP